MSTTPESEIEAVQAAVIGLLRADETISGLLGRRIYDEPPGDEDKPTPPYAYVDAANLQRVEAGCGASWRLRLRVFVVDTGMGRPRIWKIVRRMMALLDQAEPALAGGFVLHDRITVVQAGDVIEPANPKSAFLDLATVVA